MFRRPRFRPIHRDLINEMPPMLRHANELLYLRQYGEAARLFDKLAVGARTRGLPQAPHLFMTAGHCHAQNQKTDEAVIDFKQGLELMASAGRDRVVLRSGAKCVAELSELGHQKEANELEQLIKKLVGDTILQSSPVENTHKSAVIPTLCEACGGSLRSDEVDWVDESTIECPWCGTIIRLE